MISRYSVRAELHGISTVNGEWCRWVEVEPELEKLKTEIKRLDQLLNPKPDVSTVDTSLMREPENIPFPKPEENDETKITKP